MAFQASKYFLANRHRRTISLGLAANSDLFLCPHWYFLWLYLATLCCICTLVKCVAMELQGWKLSSSLLWRVLRDSTQIFSSPVRCALHHNLESLRCLTVIGGCSPFWHLSALLCSQGIPLAGPTKQAAVASSCFPDCWKHCSWEESHISQQADEKISWWH